MESKGSWLSLRTLSIVGAMTGVLCACAAPSPTERAKYLDLHYGTACAASAQGSTGVKYDECVTNAYKADKQRALAQYNADAAHTGMAPLLLFH